MMTLETLSKILVDVERRVGMSPRAQGLVLREILQLKRSAPLSTLVRAIIQLKPK